MRKKRTPVEKISEARKRMSENEIVRTFETLGVATKEQRDKLLSQGLVAGLDEPTEPRYVTRLSDNGDLSPVETSDAKLEGDS